MKDMLKFHENLSFILSFIQKLSCYTKNFTLSPYFSQRKSIVETRSFPTQPTACPEKSEREVTTAQRAPPNEGQSQISMISADGDVLHIENGSTHHAKLAQTTSNLVWNTIVNNKIESEKNIFPNTVASSSILIIMKDMSLFHENLSFILSFIQKLSCTAKTSL